MYVWRNVPPLQLLWASPRFKQIKSYSFCKNTSTICRRIYFYFGLDISSVGSGFVWLFFSGSYHWHAMCVCVYRHRVLRVSYMIQVTNANKHLYIKYQGSIMATGALVQNDQARQSTVCLRFVIDYRNWYQYWGHCCLINDLGSSPQPEGEARGLWWASQVVNETTMTEIEVSISILSCWK